MKKEVIDGIKYRLNEDKLTAEVIGDSHYKGDITIPETVIFNKLTYRVESIEEKAFCWDKNITSIIIPNSVTSIGECAFKGCDLTSIKVTEGNIVYDSRNNCNAIIEKATNTLICGCKNTTIPDSVTSIGDNAFSGIGLTSIIIPEGITSIGECAIEGCESLTSIEVAKGNTVYDSRNNCNAIIEKATNTLICGCKNTTIPDSVTSIGDNAFSNIGLTSIIIPDSVTSIGEYAFYDCPLTSIVIGNGVISIGDNAFSNIRLTSIIIPDSVTSIGEYAFYDCPLTSVVIGNGVTNIGDFAFKGCNDLTSIEVAQGNIAYDSRYNCNAIIETATNTLICGCQNTIIPNSVKSIEKMAFAGCNLTSIIIPDSVMGIATGGLCGCARA